MEENFSDKVFAIKGENNIMMYMIAKPDDIVIVEFDDLLFKNIKRPIFASDLQEYERPITLLKKNEEDNTFKSYDILTNIWR